MRALYHHALKPLLFRLDPETAHAAAGLALRALHAAAPLRRALRPAPDPALAVRALGRTFASPVGVAAGFDKAAAYYNGLGALGFGAVEVGTVTARAQPGNPRPRLFRLPRDGALVNRMGFNNPGAAAVEAAVRARPPDGVVLGINLGKSRATALAEAAADYAESARRLAPLAHYLVVNVSSPNTPGLRSLQSVEALRAIARAVRPAADAAGVPVLVKVAPDLADDDLDAVTDLCLEERLAGLVATNTTTRRDGLATPAPEVRAAGEGGLSGRPLRARALAVIHRVYARSRGALTIVGVGGVASADDAWDALAAGATLVQVYTALVYEGPTLARDIARGLAARLRREGLASVRDVVGAGHRGG